MSYATLNGVRIVSGSIATPSYGAWVADLLLATAEPLSGPAASLSVGDLTLQGSLIRQDVFAGSRRVRLVGGAGGWRKPITPQAYQSSGGVNVSTLLGDVAAAVGEKVSIASDSSVGQAFVREGGVDLAGDDVPAERVLRQLAPTWWIDPSGVTQVGPRPGGAITSQFDVIDYDGGRGLFEVATETLSDWMPGRTFTTSLVPTAQTVSLSRIDVQDSGTLRLHVLVGQPIDADRLFDAFRRLIRSEVPQQTFLGTYEYAVQGTDGSTVDATPTASGLNLPGITGCRIRTGIAGASCKPQVGSLLAVSFLNGNPNSPIVLGGFDDNSAQSVTLDAGTGTHGHYVTAEAVVNLFLNFLVLLNSVGDPSTWSSSGKIFDPNTQDPALPLLLSKVTAWLNGAANDAVPITTGPIPSGPPTEGGLLLPPFLAVIESAIASKTTDLAGLAPGVGCPNVHGG